MLVSLPLAWPRGVVLARQSAGLPRPAPLDQAGHEHGSCPKGAEEELCAPRQSPAPCMGSPPGDLLGWSQQGLPCTRAWGTGAAPLPAPQELWRRT